MQCVLSSTCRNDELTIKKYIHFIEHSSAVSFYRHALYNGVMVKNRRLHVAFQAQSKEIPRFLHDEIDRGLTRCLAIEGILNADMLKNDCLHYGNVERIAFSETKCVFSSVLSRYQSLDTDQSYHSPPSHTLSRRRGYYPQNWPTKDSK